MKLSCVLLFIVCGNQLLTDAMHGGDIDYIEKVPYMAQVFRLYKGGLKSFCGAAILTGRWLVTAAHCTAPKETVLSTQVRVGTNYTLTGGELYNISRIINYKQYYNSANRWNDDISLIKLEGLVKFNNNRQPISISRVPPKVGDEIVIDGYGDDYDGVYGTCLKVGYQKVISIDECRKAFSRTDRKNIEIDNRVFCTNSTTLDLCPGLH
ncbi:trypsin-4-like [Phymastichus coffea]|uniref:trypsin-4-like n=1 Tax=Phymastichus coffea TaxID=108790 RepID=UPI00273BC6EA|nr:trypsin-4-like [Phymastichus coffea]